MTQQDRLSGLQAQYDTQKVLNPSGSCNLVKDFFTAFEMLSDTMRENERLLKENELLEEFTCRGIDLAFDEGLEDCLGWCAKARKHLHYRDYQDKE